MDDRFDWESLPIVFCIVLIVVLLTAFYSLVLHPTEEPLPELNHYPIPEEIVVAEDPEVEEIPAQEEKEPILSDEEIIARVVYSESRGEKLLGQVAVAYTILNRCDYYGRTVESIVKEPNQYTYDETVKPSAENFRAVIIAELIKDFIPDLFPDTMMWFKRDDYHTDQHCGKPYIQIGKHYFNYLPESEE